MARAKLSEYKAKKLLHEFLDLPYSGLQVTDSLDVVDTLDSSKKYAAKVDEGIKKRNKKGLVKVGLTTDEIKEYIKELQEKGYTQFIVEDLISHEESEEKYISLQRVREGIQIFYSVKGGVDIEENQDSVRNIIIGSPADQQFNNSDESVATELGIEPSIILKLIEFFEQYHFSFMEINPFVIHDSKFMILDLAGEVDSVAEFFVNGGWTSSDFTTGEVREKTDEEKAIEQLSENSQAAFTLDVLNPDGSVFMLLSGGGASIVLADEVAARGKGSELANYGEYSGNPNQEETYIYTKNILSLLLKSKASKKVLIVGGGVANFTDVRITFRGVIKALDEVKDELLQQDVKVYVRRGGPNQKEGLAMMKEFLEKNSLFGEVSGPDMVLTEIVDKAVKSI